MTQNTRSQRTQQPPQPDVIDLGKLLGLLLDGKWIIIFTTFAFAVVGVAYALLATPIYKADALIQVEQKNSGMPVLSEGLSDMFAQESNAATEIEIIKSRMVLGKTVEKFNLTTVASPDYLPVIGKGLATRLGTEAHIKVERFEIPDYAETGGYTLTLDNPETGAYTLYDQNEKLLLKGTVGQLASSSSTLGSTQNPEAQSLEPSSSTTFILFVSQLVGQQGQEFNLSKRSKLTAINWLATNLSVSERGKQSGILSFGFEGPNSQQNIDVLNDIATNYFLQNVDRNAAEAENSLEFLQEKLPEIKSQLTINEDALNQYRQDNESVDLGLEAQSTLKVMVELEAQLNELTFKESELAQRFTKEHPAYVAVLEKRKTLEAQKRRLEGQIRKLPKTQRAVLRLTRDVQVNQEIYVQLLNKSQELAIVKASTVGNVRILDKADSNGLAVKPKKPLIVVLATLLGGMLSVAFVLLRAAFHRGVESPDQIEEIGLSVYATIPKSEQQDKINKQLQKLKKAKKTRPVQAALLTEVNPADLAVEALRSLRTSLHFAMMEAKNNVIMITGPSPGIGKSFVSTNFASVIASSGQKVLVIDADMRKGHIGAGQQFAHSHGLSEVLVNSKSVEEVIHKSLLENLDFIAKGKTPPNPSELLMHARFTELVKWASENYDIVLIDTPPVLAVTDAAIVGRHSGTTLMVSRFGVTSTKELEVATDRLEQAGVETKGVILNAVEKTASSYYTYGYYNYAYKSE
ncbi:polysaccharide biosynthesis tyrosine autokinase [Vibrio breoganii]|uniref:polysaccharide biosynthesis tyrosine autokinase n=1 Tax=Vibrio breoganii TaxID=553239 RepID=UPI000C852EB7|nr:polysaccharide biosynthesis tyrosine autokinase [Vibrio breoganii]PMG94222.1 tyrosine-protein kinase [Vibrio breoganii]PMG95092.1 tyrosine-protein kinase [Vibrio breoganii]PMK74242.1 tyrosine-protein kinase [Vibrio breoganii]